MVIEAAIGEDYSSEGAHKMCTDLSPNCLKPREATTFLTLLETGLYDGRPASKVLLIPKTGMYFVWEKEMMPWQCLQKAK